jgi:hypothetical protein
MVAPALDVVVGPVLWIVRIRHASSLQDISLTNSSLAK